MILARYLDILRPRDLLIQVAPDCDRNQRITLAMENQRRHPDQGQHVTDIAFVAGSKQRLDSSWTRRRALQPAKPFDEGVVVSHTRRIDTDQDALTPVRVQRGKESIELLLAQCPWFRLNRCKGPEHH